MRAIRVCSVLSLAVAALVALPLRAEDKKRTTPTVDDLAFLEGSWSGPSGAPGTTFEAIYSAPRGGVIQSMSRELAGEGLSFFEFEVFQQQGDGVVMSPYPGGTKSKALFRWVEFDAGKKSAKFVCPEHDFPNEIVYERVSDDAVKFTVKGKQDGKDVDWILDLKRVK